MNIERIKELKQQATNEVDSVDAGLGIEHYREFVDLKFAKLVWDEAYRKGLDDGWTDAMNRE